MPYIPSLNDIPEESSYSPSLSDIPENDFSPSFGEKLAPNILVGLAQMGHGIINTPSNVGKFLESKFPEGTLASKLGLKASSIPRQQDYDYAKLLKLPENATLSDKLIQGFAEYAPSMALPAADIGIAGKAISKIPGIGGYLEKAAGNIIPQSAFGSTQTENPLVGAGEGAITGAVAPAIEGAINSLRPSQFLRGNLSPEELAKNLEITKGTNTGLGDVIESPYLKRQLENTLTAVPFSGATQVLQKTGKQTQERGEELMSRMLGDNNPDKVPETLATLMSKQYKDHRNLKENLYNEVDELAEKRKLNLELPEFAKKANKYMDAIESTNILKHEPDSKKILNKLINYKNPVKETKNIGSIVDKEGNPLINETIKSYPTLKEANILKGTLRDYSKSFATSPDASQRRMAKVFGDLSSSLKNDIKNSVEKSGDEVLKKSYGKAEENYAKNFSPFLDKQIYKFVSGNADPETLITKFIKTSSHSDLANTISKLSERLPQGKSLPGQIGKEGKEVSPQKLLAYGYFSRALDNEGNLNPGKLSTAIRKLGKNQFKALVPDESFRDELLNYSKLATMNKEGALTMFNPKTGQRAIDPMASVIAAHLTGGAIGEYQGGHAGGIAGLIAPSLLGKVATKKLTSPVFREKLVKSMIKNKKWKFPGMATTGAINPLMTMNLNEYKGTE